MKFHAVMLAVMTACGVVGCSAPGAVAADGRLTLAQPVAEPGTVRGVELARVDAPSLRDALERLRPEFLRTNLVAVSGSAASAAPTVYVDDKRVGSPDVLELMTVAEVFDVRYLRPAAARISLGASCDCPGGVILVTTRGRR